MKNATQYAAKIKKLLSKIKSHEDKDGRVEVDGPEGTLLLGMLARTAPEKKAADALSNLRAATVDLNDLRVTPVAETVQIIGTTYPDVRSVASEMAQVLNSIFNQLHEMDLSMFKGMAKKQAIGFLDDLDGLSPYAHAFFRQRWLSSTAVPLTEDGLNYLIKTGHLPEGTELDEAQKFLGNHFKDDTALTLSSALKIYAASPAARKEMREGGASAGKKKTTKKKSTSKAKTAAKPKIAATSGAASSKKTKTAAAKKKRLRR